MLVREVSPSDLHAAYGQDRCPICVLNDRDERRYIDSTLYDQVTNVQWRAHIREARGFCATHTTRILDEGRSALGVALIADDLLKTVQELIGGSVGTRSAWSRLTSALGNSGSALAGRLRRKEPCPLCGHLRLQTPVHLRSMLLDLADMPGKSAYRMSAGLCMPHLVGALEIGEPQPGLDVMITRQQEIWRGLEAELQEFIRKNDYQFTGETSGPERDAWRRSFRLLAGWQAGQHL